MEKIALELLNEKLRDDGTIEISAPINPEMLTEGSEAAIAHMEALTATRLKTEEKKKEGEKHSKKVSGCNRTPS